ncbi:chain length determinant protein EpsF [Aquabacterium sp.]|uniref:chain length determinant protein EpsF n=1 Tax=Aquabacterium sp. TaxID=1872578 RepID=UPI002489E215|nr:chain length determinant protein EpsF [Aquabacterium sp.]MDI1349268.1 chain length determinant protein EpsF [Aquabacterium sp.]
MSFTDFLRVIRARWVLATSIFAVLTLAALIGSLVWPKKYTAQATLMIDLKVDPVAGTSATGVMQSAAFLTTQVDIIESQHVAQKVIANLQLADNTDFRNNWEKQGRKGDYASWLADAILANLKVEAARESNIVNISYSHTDAKLAQAMANSFAKAYIDSTVQFKTNPARQYSEFFEERANLARQKLEKAQVRLSEAQQAKGILVTDERLDAETVKFNELSSQLTSLRGLLADSGSRSRQALRAGDIAPDAMSSSLVTSLRTELSRQQAKLDEAQERYGDNHPNILETRANIASIQDKLRQETSRVTRSLGATDQINQGRLVAIQAAFDAQREKLLKLKEDRNELMVIEREVGAAQRVYDAIQARQSQMSLEGSNNQNNVVVLSTATEPVTPSAPRVGVNTVIGALLGMVLAAFVTILVELGDRTVRSTSDMVNLLQTPVIGYLSSRQTRKRWWHGRDESVLYPLESHAYPGLETANSPTPGRLN